jgi:plastocyanin domain-containing protein
MSVDQIFVLVAGIMGIAVVNWWFFAPRRPARSASGGNGVQELTVVVDGGYAPAALLARAGAPLRLTFDRRDSSSCSEEVVLPDFGIRRFLPAGTRTTIELPAPSPGKYEFTCGMGMLRGSLTVEPSRGA